jgi:hypothetical protein
MLARKADIDALLKRVVKNIFEKFMAELKQKEDKNGDKK